MNDLYFCRKCSTYIGQIAANGALCSGNFVLEHGTFICRKCGEKKVWGAADFKLDKIVARQLQRRQRLTKEVVG